jgi:hypothetical protein
VPRRRCIAGAVLSLASLAWTTSSEAAPHSGKTPIRVALTESLPEECAKAVPILERVRARTDRIERATTDAVDAKVFVTVHREGARLLGTLVVEEGAERTERTVSAPACEDVVAAFAVMLVVALDREAETPEVPVHEPSPAPEAPPPHVTPRPLPRGRARSRSPLVLGGGVGFGLPAYDGFIFEPTFMLEARLATSFQPRVRLALSRSAHDSVETRSARVDLVWTTGRASFCGAPRWLQNQALALCAGASVGELEAVVARPGGPARGLFWFAVGPSIVREVELGWRLGLQLEAGLAIPLLRDRFYFEPRTLAYQAPAVMPFFGVTLLTHVLPFDE